MAMSPILGGFEPARALSKVDFRNGGPEDLNLPSPGDIPRSPLFYAWKRGYEVERI